MLKNTATKIALFVFTVTDGTPKTGDAANLTAYVSKDYGTVTVLADTSATEMDATNAPGWYLFDVAQAESNADALLFTGKSATANVKIVGQYIFPQPPLFTSMSVDASGRVDVIKIAGTTQTARDVGASVLLSTGTGTGQLDFTSGVVKANVTQNAGSGITSAAGVQEVKVQSIAANAITATSINADAITAAKVADGTIDAATFAAGAINAAAIAADAITDAKVASDVTIASVTGAVGSVTGAVGSVTGLTASDVGAIKAKTDNLPSDPADASDIAGAFGTVNATLATIASYVDTEIGTLQTAVTAVKTKTDFLPSATAGAAGGLFLAGSNAATTLASMTVTGELHISNGIVVAASTTDKNAVTFTGNGTGAGLQSIGGPSNGYGVWLAGQGTGYGLYTVGGDTGDSAGFKAESDSPTGTGMWVQAGSVSVIDVGVTLLDIQDNSDHLNTTLMLAPGSPGEYRFTADALAYAPSGGGAGGGSGLDAAGVRAAIGLASANLDTQLSGIQSDTDNIQTRLPAALIGGRIDATVGAMQANVMTAASAASDLTTELQSGLATQVSVDDLPTNAELATALGTADDAVLVQVALVKAKTDLIPASPAAVGDVPTAAQNADKLLGRNIEGGSDSGRIVREALYPLRNKWSNAAGTYDVYKTDDTTLAWSSVIGSDVAADPIISSDPS